MKHPTETATPPGRSLERLVLRLREQLGAMTRRADYVCAHRFGHDSPTGTRIIAVEDLRAETERSKVLLSETENDQAERLPAKKL